MNNEQFDNAHITLKEIELELADREPGIWTLALDVGLNPARG